MSAAVISKQTLATLRQKFKFIGRAEVDELEKILVPGESVLECLNGFYSGGFALMVVTNLRLLLIDKKPFMLNVEDLRYDMITEVDYHARLLDASAVIHTPSKQLRFTSWRQRQLRSLTTFIQHHVMQMRQQATGAQSSYTQPVYIQQPVTSARIAEASVYEPSITSPYMPARRVEQTTFDEASLRRLTHILRRPRIGKFLLTQQ